MSQPPLPRPELLLSATLLLLAKGASQNACPGQLRAIHQHLELLSAHPGLSAMVRDTCRELAQGLAVGGQPTAARPHPGPLH